MRVCVALSDPEVAGEIRRALTPMGIDVVPLPVRRPTARIIARAGRKKEEEGEEGEEGEEEPLHSSSSSSPQAYAGVVLDPGMPELARVLDAPHPPGVALWVPHPDERSRVVLAGVEEEYPWVKMLESGRAGDAARWLASIVYPIPTPLPEHRREFILYAVPRVGSSFRNALDAYWHVSRSELGFNDAHLYPIPHISLTSFFKAPRGFGPALPKIVDWALATLGDPEPPSVVELVQNETHVVLAHESLGLVEWIEALVPVLATCSQGRIELKPKPAGHLTLAKNYASRHFVDLFDLALRLGLDNFDHNEIQYDLALYERLPVSEDTLHRREYNLPSDPLPLSEICTWPLRME